MKNTIMKDTITKYTHIMALLAACTFVFASSALALPAPTDEIKPTLNAIITILLDPALKGEEKKTERRTKIMAYVNSGFDFREMSQRVIGKEWRELTPEKQDHFQRLFTKLLENAYIGKFESYSGQEIQYLGERIKDDRAIVTTQIENNGQFIPIDYVMIKKEVKWMVYDINIEGVSLVRNYMEQFKAILRRDKFDGLVKLLEDKNSTFE
ncbi:MAG: ABC-type transport system involved in resistance to organic solvent auxiliary [Desulfobulbaceae bacterium]|jgi:phospholipid transport system substrate-binding protein|nr:MAG: ABC-type transport system involved in resistance to organic solvent auxiliary [Desulfobulbaceae bacterium]